MICTTVVESVLTKVRYKSVLLSIWNYFLIFLDFILFYVYECFACRYVCVPRACLVPAEVKKRVSDSLKLNYDGDKPPCGCWKLNLDPLQEQQVFFTTELCLQTPSMYNFYSMWVLCHMYFLSLEMTFSSNFWFPSLCPWFLCLLVSICILFKLLF